MNVQEINKLIFEVLIKDLLKPRSPYEVPPKISIKWNSEIDKITKLDINYKTDSYQFAFNYKKLSEIIKSESIAADKDLLILDSMGLYKSTLKSKDPYTLSTNSISTTFYSKDDQNATIRYDLYMDDDIGLDDVTYRDIRYIIFNYIPVLAIYNLSATPDKNKVNTIFHKNNILNENIKGKFIYRTNTNKYISMNRKFYSIDITKSTASETEFTLIKYDSMLHEKPVQINYEINQISDNEWVVVKSGRDIGTMVNSVITNNGGAIKSVIYYDHSYNSTVWKNITIDYKYDCNEAVIIDIDWVKN